MIEDDYTVLARFSFGENIFYQKCMFHYHLFYSVCEGGGGVMTNEEESICRRRKNAGGVTFT